MVRRVGPGTEVGDQAVFLWILMDVGDQMDKVGVGGDRYPAKGTLEQGTSAVIGFVDGFGIGVEQVGKVLTGFLET